MIDSNTLKYEPYRDSRTATDRSFKYGQSGELLLAESEDGARYLVKHTFPHNAANEYVALWLASKMDIPCPRAELLSPNKRFRTPYAVAIEYMSGFVTFAPDDMTDKLKSDFAAHYSLAMITATDDKVQMRKVGDRLYSFDYSEAFYLGEFQLNAFGISDNFGEEFLARSYRSYSKRNLIFDLPDIAGEYHISPEQMKGSMLHAARRILSITDDDIKEMEDELDQIYPVAVSVYYELCIKAMQEKISQYAQDKE